MTLACGWCKTLFSVPPSAIRAAVMCCSLSCAALNSWRTRTRRITKLCAHCGQPISVKPSLAQRRRFCSRSCLGAWTVRHQSRPTKGESRLGAALARCGILFNYQHPLGRFLIDFVIGHLAIEIDGERWHRIPENVARDIAKAAAVADAGLVLVRIDATRVESAPDDVVLWLIREYRLPMGSPYEWNYPSRTCSIEGCLRIHKARGLCGAHYLRLRRRGSPNAPPVRIRGGCSVDGCRRPHFGRGWCQLHHRRWWRDARSVAAAIARRAST